MASDGLSINCFSARIKRCDIPLMVERRGASISSKLDDDLSSSSVLISLTSRITWLRLTGWNASLVRSGIASLMSCIASNAVSIASSIATQAWQAGLVRLRIRTADSIMLNGPCNWCSVPIRASLHGMHVFVIARHQFHGVNAALFHQLFFSRVLSEIAITV